MRESVTRVLDEWVDRQAKDRGLTRIRAPKDTGQLVLETIVTELEQDQRKQMELERRLLEEEAEQIRQELLTGIEDAARAQADPAQRLFAEDTARGLKLLEILSKHYDVVVMNPPYGSFVPKVKDFVKAAYQLTSNDIYATFLDRATQLTNSRRVCWGAGILDFCQSEDISRSLGPNSSQAESSDWSCSTSVWEFSMTPPWRAAAIR